ncbi:MAG: glycosyltransferase [Phycisphaerales bacterium]|nr:glycosyltransferase [Phycisphaerales bacterium]
MADETAKRTKPGRPADAGPTLPADLLFEAATEVCNQVGGIYQVLRSKAPAMVKRWRERYCLLGPYVEKTASLEFEERPAPKVLARALEGLVAHGVTARHGRWLVSSRPRVILFQHHWTVADLDRLKYGLWERHRISTPAGDTVVDNAVYFAETLRLFFRELTAAWASHHGSPDGRKPPRFIAHFHEWLGGLTIPDLRRDKLPVASVFTTHATLLGRYAASNEEDFYDWLPFKNQESEARRYNIVGQHGIERACAHGAHVFTTVSSITGEECTHLLSRTPDLITPNGLNTERFSVGHEFQHLHADFKARLHRFTLGYFFPSYSFDLENTLYFFTSGRFEPRNKGFDLCLEALARLNTQLKDFGIPKTVVFFIITSRPTRFILPSVLHSRGVLDELDNVCSHIMREVGHKLFPMAAAGKRVNIDKLVDQYWALRYRRTQQALKRADLPPVITHALWDEDKDPVLSHIRQLQLFNRKDDPVKIVYHPEFVSPVSPLWGMEYDQFVRGCHLGVFPSAYEPWGYTPLECMALGTPAITSDLAGFGRYVSERNPDHDDWGLTVLKRRGRGFHDAAADLAMWMLAFCRLDRRGRIDLRNKVETHAVDFDWARLASAYDKAHDLAAARAFTAA